MVSSSSSISRFLLSSFVFYLWPKANQGHCSRRQLIAKVCHEEKTTTRLGPSCNLRNVSVNIGWHVNWHNKLVNRNLHALILECSYKSLSSEQEKVIGDILRRVYSLFFLKVWWLECRYLFRKDRLKNPQT